MDKNAESEERVFDFYRIVAHEIGHAVGFTNQLMEAREALEDAGAVATTCINFSIAEIIKLKDSFGLDVTFVAGGHLYPGGPSDPSGLTIHPYNLMSAVHSDELCTPVPLESPGETTRQFISDLEVQILEAVYDYDVVLPSTLDSAHVMLDSLTGTLLVQGSARDETSGAGFNDTITIEPDPLDNDFLLVTVTTPNGSFQERELVNRVKDIVIHGNGGSDTFDIDPLEVPQQVTYVDYVVSSNQDIADVGTSNTDGFVDISDVVPDSQTTLRGAIVESNVRSGQQGIYVGRGTYDLSLTGTGGDTEGDFDITDEVTIIGAGAGATIINAATLGDRHFDVSNTGQLELVRMTLAGGGEPTMGGSIHVADLPNPETDPGVTALTLIEMAIADNSSSQVGGAFYVGKGTNASIERSVITNDDATYLGGGIAAAEYSQVTLTATIVAKNSASIGNPDFASGRSGSNLGEFLSGGNNLIGDAGTANFSSGATDHISPSGTVDYVVTSLLDSFDHNDDEYALSIREAIHLANTNDDTLEEIWVPAWNFVLTRDRETYGGGSLKDVDIAFGDLDISDSLIIRGVSMDLTRVQWKLGVRDAVFDVWGDYTGTGLAGSPDDYDVDGADHLAWQGQFNSTGNPNEFSADGDDDGDVDGDDLAMWQDHYGNSLVLTNLTAILA